MDLIRHWFSWHYWQFLAALWIVFCLLLVSQELWPRAKQVISDYYAWQQNLQKISDMQDWENRSMLLTKKTARLEEQVQELYISIPNNDQMSVILDCLQQSSRGINLTLQQIKTADPITFDSHLEQPIHVVASGHFHDVGVFIDRVEKSPYLIKVASMKVSRTGSLKDALIAELDLNAIVLSRN